KSKGQKNVQLITVRQFSLSTMFAWKQILTPYQIPNVTDINQMHIHSQISQIMESHLNCLIASTIDLSLKLLYGQTSTYFGFSLLISTVWNFACISRSSTYGQTSTYFGILHVFLHLFWTILFLYYYIL
ncbi:hypothetical protein ACJX0J_009085, partial [Zea mays]